MTESEEQRDQASREATEAVPLQPRVSKGLETRLFGV